MNTPESLAITFATAVATSAGKSLVDWVKGRFNSDAAEAAHTLATDPEDDSAMQTLVEILETELGNSPSLTEELRRLLDQVEPGYASQTGSAGGGSTIIQIQGNNNRIRD